tara:strand:+ start:918 stop:1130 length:213 start_codon:yes stop_codon:yes gene_type:complete
MSVSKNTAVKLNPSTLTDHEVKDNKNYGRVDINNLLDRARKEKSDERRTSVIYTSLFSLIVIIVITVISF